MTDEQAEQLIGAISDGFQTLAESGRRETVEAIHHVADAIESHAASKNRIGDYLREIVGFLQESKSA